VQGNTQFALDLYRSLFTTNRNLFSSPYSISLALAMVYAGARGDTEAEMARTLHFSSRADLQTAFNALDQALRSRGENVKEGERFRLNIVNAIWGQKGFDFQSEFLDALAQYYGAGLRIVDFKQAAEAARQAINQWVAEQTADKIKDLLPQGSLDDMTRLVLTNAIYFNAAWQNPFNEQSTQDGTFYLLDGGQVTVPMMHQNELLGYASGTGYQLVELPYVGGDMAMDIIVPEAGNFAEWAQHLDAGELEYILRGVSPTQVQLTMPRFRFESSTELKDALQKLGMSQSFTEAADFSGMTGRPDLYIDNVYHKAFVAVDEKGTEAAAATAVVMRPTSMPAQPVEVTVDRPFLFLIRDVTSGTVLFLGHVVNPA
jgi:serpin B